MITREVAEKVRDVVDAGLVSGVGVAEPGKMCVEAAVCYAMGLPHGDNPSCVEPALRHFKIRLNDSRWSSPQARAKGLRRLAIAQLGSAGVLDGAEFRRRIVGMTIRRAVPIGLRAAATLNPAHADALKAAAVRCEQEGTLESCEHAKRVARAAAAAAAYAAYAVDAADAAADADAAYAYADAYADAADAAADADAAYADAYADAADAAYAADAAAVAYAADAYADAAAVAYAADAAYADAAAVAYAADAAAADAAAVAYAADAADAAAAAVRTGDRVLSQYAEWAVEILIEMKAPGCEWLNLVPKER